MIKIFIEQYVHKLIELLNIIDKDAIEKIVQLLEESAKHNSKVYILGNGGSAATASHMVNDLGVGLKRRDIAKFNVISLADNTPVCSAIANDIGYENIFYMQLKDVLQKDDVVIAISCSGNSPNIIKTVKYANEIGSTVVGMTGFHGGELKKLSDISFHVETANGEYGLVEDMHMILDHIIYSYYIETSERNG
jgi:D-sedoheptulose 7-phosphate isomerase